MKKFTDTIRLQPKLPEIQLEEGEKIELDIRRSKLGCLAIYGGMALAFILLTAVSIAVPRWFANKHNNLLFAANGGAVIYLYLIFATLYLLLAVVGVVMLRVYKGNRLVVTNKRLIQYSVLSLFAQSTNVIDLTSVEDVSFKQSNFLEYIFKIGTIRMSTVGDETTYTFDYVDTPTDELALITHLVHVEKERANSRV